MDRIDGAAIQLLDRVPTIALFWTWTIARLLMCGVVYLALLAGSSNPALISVLQLLCIGWLGWTATTTLVSVARPPRNPKLLTVLIFGDISLTLAAMLLLRGFDGAIIAFGLTVAVIAMGIRLDRNWILSGLALGVITFFLRDIAFLGYSLYAPMISTRSPWSQFGEVALLFSAAVVLILWAYRMQRLAAFERHFSSLRTLSFEKSFEYDLQPWVNAIADLFRPQKAACVIHASARYAAHQYYDQNLPLWKNDDDRDALVIALRNLPTGCSIFDTQKGKLISADTGTVKHFNDNEQGIADMLRRANIKAALVQPMQIDRARGGIICALDSPLHAISLTEASFIGRHVSEMTVYLGKVATAQRNFIADAHDVARRDLHDGVLQTLAALRMRLLVITKHNDVANTPVEFEIRKAVDIVTLEQSRLRGFLEASEASEHTVNLVSQIDICARTISLQWGIDVVLQSEELAIPVDTESSFNIEHLLREVITNAVRHAKSNSLTVSLSLQQDALIMAVTDVSEAPDDTQVTDKSALTLESASLRDRLRLVNGEAFAEGLGNGTLLSIRIPMHWIEND